MKIAIQGIEGCFHQIAANKYFGHQVDVLPCLSFDDLIKTIKQDLQKCILKITGRVEIIKTNILPRFIRNGNLTNG